MSSDVARRLVAGLLVVMVSQLGCYNNYFVTKSELQKLESTVEPKEVVTVQGNCKGARAGLTPEEHAPDSKLLAQADEASGEGETASDATGGSNGSESSGEEKTASKNCVSVAVSTSNPIRVVTNGGEQFRVTPFNFEMTQTQLVSPEYDLLLSLDQVEGAEVKDFSTWKTVATIAGATVASVGTFVAISALAPDQSGFSE